MDATMPRRLIPSRSIGRSASGVETADLLQNLRGSEREVKMIESICPVCYGARSVITESDIATGYTESAACPLCCGSERSETVCMACEQWKADCEPVRFNGKHVGCFSIQAMCGDCRVRMLGRVA